MSTRPDVAAAKSAMLEAEQYQRSVAADVAHKREQFHAAQDRLQNAARNTLRLQVQHDGTKAAAARWDLEHSK